MKVGGNHHAAIHQRRRRHRRLERRHRETVPEGDRRGVDLGPAARHQRRGVFGKLRLQSLQLAGATQEFAVVLHPQLKRHGAPCRYWRNGRRLPARSEYGSGRDNRGCADVRIAAGARASKVELISNSPESSAIATVNALSVEPIS